ncbi:eCIS core domain-containing protein [Mucilaginibacter flavidus]|uniref:eCIS core domain-containing protein n=1 Tax=Mucilaginibacter flavidus TaxID=2949309 RepID=UPI002092FC54|nr:DUF4157 domain-containing protein [Mucilaginibacter flavidus]MCO5947149.1 DUF4157 domain-containing protein [Mucilaginibacter flavidus]
MSLTATAKLTSKATAEGQSKRTALRVESKPPAKQTADTEEATAERTREASPYTHNFGVVPLYPGRQPFVQPKLTVNKPGDKYEQEADSMADKVMRMAEPSAGEVLTGNISDVVQRKCDACEDEDKDKTPVMRKEEGAVDDSDEQAVMRKKESAADTDEEDGGEDGEVMRKEEDSADTDEEDGGEDGEVMRKEEDSADTDEDDGGQDGEVMRKDDESADTGEDDGGDDDEVMRKEEDPNTNAKNDEVDEEQVMREAGKSAAEPQAAGSWQSSLNSSKSGGAPLPVGTKRFMESAFQTDFSSVRVHTDSRAAEMSKGIQARAFTHGSDIYFNTGQFTPENAEGKRLLAHELTHVLQQQNGVAPSLLQRKMSNGGVGGGAAVQVAPAMAAPAVAAPTAAPGGPGAVSAPPSAKQSPGATPGGSAAKGAPGGEKGKEVKPVEKDKDKSAEAPKADTSSTTAYLASLQHQQPTDFISSMKSADADVNQIHGKEKDDLQKDMPVIDQPTGLPTLEKTIATRAAMEQAAAKKAAAAAKKAGGEKPKADTPEIKIPEKPIVKTPPALAQPQVDDRGVFEKALSNSIASLPTTDDSISTSLGPRRKPDLTNDADPNEINKESAEQEALVTQQQTNADALTKQDFGENNIYPDLKPGKLKPGNKLTPPARVSGEAVKPPEASAEVVAAFNTGALSKMQVETAAQVQKNDEAAAKMQDDKDKEKKDKMRQIDEQTELAKRNQQKEQAKAKKEVSTQRETWTAENEKITKDYNDSVKQESDSKSGEIDTKVKKTNDDIEAEYKKNEDDLADQKAKADEKAAAKKKEAEEKQESGGFFSAVGDFLSDVWDSIKDAVNFIFDELRKAVKFIIEKVKAAVDILIDAIRDIVVGLIKAFGEMLKTFVNIAFAAFPDLAKKINGYIDDAVDYSVDAVNKWADDLKKAVNALLDALGAALDFILSLYQKAFNLLIDALKFLTVGLMKILQGLANLVTSASQAPDHFWSQVSVEVIGQDITNPLPNEIGYDKSKDETQIGNGFETLEYGKKALGIEDKKEPGPEQEALTADDVVNNEVVENLQLDPALAEQLQSKGDGETEFGGTPGNETALDDARADASQADAAKAEAMKGADSGTIDAAKGAAEQVVDNAGKVGPFKNAWERGQYVLGQIKTAISTWWGKNSGKVIAGLIAGLLAGIVLEVVTGGAVTAAIPVIMELLATLFAAQDIADGIVFLGTYVVSAWQGQIAKGAMALARTFVKLIMAFIFDLIGGGEMIKGIKGGIKAAEEGGAKGLMQFGKSAARNLAAKELKNVAKLGTIAKDGAKAAMENGRLVLNGLKTGLKDGAKSLEELSAGLLKKFRFKKFKIELKKFRFYLYGEVNPWVLLATGDLVEVKDKAGGVIGKEGKFMSKEGKEVEGILVGIGGKKFAKRLKNLTPERGADLFAKVHAIYEAKAEARAVAGKTLTKAEIEAEDLAIQKEVKQIIQERVSFDPVEFAKKHGQAAADAKLNRDKLARSLKEASPGKGFEAHHIVPVELLEKNDVLKKAVAGGFDFNGEINGKWVKRFSSRTEEGLKGVHASHPNYTEEVNMLINDTLQKSRKSVKTMTNEEAAEIMNTVALKVKKALANEPTKKLDLFKFVEP